MLKRNQMIFFIQMRNIVEYVRPCFLTLVELKIHLLTIFRNDGWFFLLQVELKIKYSL
jgi:hypothetical protein